jgi:hypothetical protein
LRPSRCPLGHYASPDIPFEPSIDTRVSVVLVLTLPRDAGSVLLERPLPSSVPPVDSPPPTVLLRSRVATRVRWAGLAPLAPRRPSHVPQADTVLHQARRAVSARGRVRRASTATKAAREARIPPVVRPKCEIRETQPLSEIGDKRRSAHHPSNLRVACARSCRHPQPQTGWRQ